jgi:hypothetical protein
MNVKDIARVCHEANRALQIAQNDPAPSPEWDSAPDWQKESAVEGVKHAISGATPEELHESWCSSKYQDGWVRGHVKDAKLKTHPCLVPYSELPEDQRIKDSLFQAVVNTLS